MEQKRKSSFLVVLFSTFYLLAALGLLLGVCGYCYPETGQWVQKVVAGVQDSPIRQAFGVLSDGLETGQTLKDAAQASFSVLMGDAG